MNKWNKGLVAGLAATVVLSILMVVKAAVGLLPALDVIAMLTQLSSEYLGLPDSAAVGWIAHFVIGVVLWGLIFVHSYDTWPGSPPVKGAVYSVMLWLLMMSMFMPMAAAGFFATNFGFTPAFVTLVLHLIFGAVLGAVYARLGDRGVARA